MTLTLTDVVYEHDVDTDIVTIYLAKSILLSIPLQLFNHCLIFLVFFWTLGLGWKGPIK